MQNTRNGCMWSTTPGVELPATVHRILTRFLPGHPRTAASRSARRRARRATAAIEFAMATPLMLTIIGGLFDFGHAEYARIALASAVSAGAQYAVLTGPGVAAANIQSAVQSTSGLDATALAVSVSNPAYDCIGGTAPSLTASNAGATCADGSAAGAYVTITATYSVNALLKAFTPNDAMTLTETATVRLS